MQFLTRICVLISVLWLVGIGNKTPENRNGMTVPISRPDLTINRLRPVSVAFSADEGTALVVSEARGSVIAIDLNSNSVAGKFESELRIGERPSSIKHLGNNRFLAADLDKHELVLLHYDSDKSTIGELERSSTIGYPKQITLCDAGILESGNGDEILIAVSGLWSQQLSIATVTDRKIAERHRVDLKFAAGPIAWLNPRFLVVADAFSDRLALVNVEQGNITKIWRREGHRIGGLDLHGDQLWFSDIKLNKIARSVTSDIHWGLLVSNELFSIDVPKLLNDNAIEKSFSPRPLGGPSDGKGDPTSIVITEQGKVVCLLQGVGELAIGSQAPDGFNYLDVGIKPVDLAINKNGTRALICNPLTDQLRLIDLENEKVERIISLSKTEASELTSVERGEQLFFDSSLSHDSWISCNTCHVGGHSNFMLNDNLSDQTFGTAKQVISLLGSQDTLPLAWNGSMKSFAEQISSSIETTMRLDTKPDSKQVEDLEAFIKTLAPAPPLTTARGEVDDRLFEVGRALFTQLACSACHTPTNYTSGDIVDVQMQDELGQVLFNPPSLLGVSQRSRFFHDGRAESLHDVLVKFGHPNTEIELSEQQLKALLHFLNSI